MSSSVSQEVVSTTRSQPEVETTDAIFGIITGGMHYKQFIKIWLYHNAYLFIQIKCYGYFYDIYFKLGVIGIVLVVGLVAFLVLRRKKEPRQNDVEIISLESTCDSIVYERQKIA